MKTKLAMQIAAASLSRLLSDSDAAKQRILETDGGPLFLADWERVVFIHYEIAAEELQPEIPFPLEQQDGSAWVSLVAFTQRRLRPAWGGFATAWMGIPVANHAFLNLRTYVRCGAETGIYFIAEWVPNFLDAFIAPRIFGLPYRLGRLNCRHHDAPGNIRGKISVERCFEYEGRIGPDARSEICKPGSRDEFLLERYTGFTRHGSKRRLFRIWHAPWRRIPAEIITRNTGLIVSTHPWFRHARLVDAHYSPGVTDVWIGRPNTIPFS